jgi:hypothetical protein
MKQTFEKIARNLYQRRYKTANAEWATFYYARFVCRLKNQRRWIPLGSELTTAKDKLARIQAQDVDLYDFDLERERLPIAKEREASQSRSRSLNFAIFTRLLTISSASGPCPRT